MKKVLLDIESLIGKGNKRLCFEYPKNNLRCIKVAHRRDGWKENVIDWIYLKYLVFRKADLSRLAMCHGWVLTNYGRGLVFDKVVNFDGKNASTLKDFLNKNLESLSPQDVLMLVSDLKLWALKNGVAVIEPNEVNIMVRDNGEALELVVIDGVGGRERFSIKNIMYIISRRYSNRKTEKQFLAFESKLKNLF
ncbi:YrbL family protein [Vreelandella arcis]|uniref:PhoP regulatory network protein YrbL n=1 Tax=Vreelandella arcis TaxID=416873 RepID=A0A1H0IQX3_9GAMM|nr:YrbL family protein [Halomonas arcis]SDO33431.1 PhoP regulatory network protein YrbL [Halomonas arcis]